MPDSLNIDLALESVKNIVDNIRCITCDKLDGNRMRYPCGHTVCAECVVVSEECSLCLTSSHTNTSSQVLCDEVLTQRVKNASSLLKTCEEVFNTDVYKRQRLSEQLKVEKQLFPECIQAPIKYYNKKRSSVIRTSYKNKKNKKSSYFLGENLSYSAKSEMEKSVNYVQDWLNQNDKHLKSSVSRKPFSDLNSNIDRLKSNEFRSPYKKISNSILKNIKENVSELGKKCKRSYYNTKNPVVESPFKTVEKENLVYNAKKQKMEFIPNTKTNIMSNDSDNDKSKNIINDEPIVIDDTQSQTIDKDKLAWMAVLEMKDSKENDLISEDNLDCSEIVENSTVDENEAKSCEIQIEQSIISQKVPFHKKGYLLETCKFCNNYNENYLNEVVDQPKVVSVTIENDNFVTTVKISKNLSLHKYINLEKHSTAVQTDLTRSNTINTYTSDIREGKDLYEILENSESVKILPNVNNLQNQTALMVKNRTNNKSGEKNENEKKTKGEVILRVSDTILKEKKCIIIDESDSASDTEERSILQVTADVHRSSDQHDYGVFTEIEKEEYQGRVKPVVRGRTPISTDSSDKENYDPNKIKKPKFKRKDPKKKGIGYYNAIMSLRN